MSIRRACAVAHRNPRIPGLPAAATWYDDELRLRFAACDLVKTLEGQTDAAQAVIDSWDRDAPSFVSASDTVPYRYGSKFSGADNELHHYLVVA